MATVEVQNEDVLAAYADEQYRKLQREKDQYVSLDEYCAKRGIQKAYYYFHKFTKTHLCVVPKPLTLCTHQCGHGKEE